MSTKFVEVYATETGRKQRVPEHFLTHPILSRGLSLTPRETAASDHASDDVDKPATRSGRRTGRAKAPTGEAPTPNESPSSGEEE